MNDTFQDRLRQGGSHPENHSDEGSGFEAMKSRSFALLGMRSKSRSFALLRTTTGAVILKAEGLKNLG